MPVSTSGSITSSSSSTSSSSPAMNLFIKRRRAFIACGACRRRKTRCVATSGLDNTLNSCTRCSIKGLKCQFQAVSNDEPCHPPSLDLSAGQMRTQPLFPHLDDESQSQSHSDSGSSSSSHGQPSPPPSPPLASSSSLSLDSSSASARRNSLPPAGGARFPYQRRRQSSLPKLKGTVEFHPYSESHGHVPSIYPPAPLDLPPAYWLEPSESVPAPVDSELRFESFDETLNINPSFDFNAEQQSYSLDHWLQLQSLYVLFIFVLDRKK
ncbi:hypothetical protein R3P38DRAFT_2804396 [Favolaschia claudopus]|uniref:Zn(2)-C6 fungal-type domain-containing protein n=1 Tax=Favolaschia claudopus TaxID=2862362 RepID=A0AAV9ZR24_9AGAR